jgi:hypothetical protein
MTQEELDKRFDYHAPDEVRQTLREEVRGLFKALAEELNDNILVTESREKSETFTLLETALLWANAAIARNI